MDVVEGFSELQPGTGINSVILMFKHHLTNWQEKKREEKIESAHAWAIKSEGVYIWTAREVKLKLNFYLVIIGYNSA